MIEIHFRGWVVWEFILGPLASFWVLLGAILDMFTFQISTPCVELDLGVPAGPILATLSDVVGFLELLRVRNWCPK